MTIIAQEPLGDFLVIYQHKGEWIVIASTTTKAHAEQIAKIIQRSAK